MTGTTARPAGAMHGDRRLVALSARILHALPRGGALPAKDWVRRHHMMVGLLWANVFAVPLYGLLRGEYDVGHSLAHAGPVLVFAVLAGMPRFGRTARSVLASLGLLTAAALLVHAAEGVTEAHFYFFVLIVTLTLYEDWLPFLVAVGYVLLHHGLTGMLDPSGVYNRPEQWTDPWKWALIHAFFVALGGVAAVVAWRYNEDVRARMLAAQRELATAATTDSLTGLGNRRKLLEDLERQLTPSAQEPATLVLLDLNGFKLYNDRFGHLAGDALLARLALRLEMATADRASVYRLGGDEFCVLASAGESERAQVEAAAAEALSEHGEAFAITSSLGSVRLPQEAADPEAALRIADQRMYAHKNGGRRSPGIQTQDVLLQVITERHPPLGEHLDGVAELAGEVARQLAVDDAELDSTLRAAALHDIGKVAIPDAILSKPGPLTENEWEFVKRHPIIGERILSAAPALADVAPLVRSSHERYDGRGYPDGLAGEDIPLGSRIIAVCDAFDAIVSGRPYRAARNLGDALTELRRCAGTQFDPRVVDAFCAAMTSAAKAPAGTAS